MEISEYSTLRSLEDSFWWYRGLHRLALDALAHLPTSTILDAGCGTGGLLSHVTPPHRGYGLDFSEHALQFARDRGLTRLTRATVEAVPLRSASLDAIVSLDVLYHAAVADDDAALAEFHRVLKPGGSLLLNLPAFSSLRSSHDDAIHTARRYRRGPLRKQLVQAGFSVDRITYWNTLLFPGLAAVRLLRRQRAPAPGAALRSDVEALPPWLNSALDGVLRLERQLVRRTDLPFGLSLLAVARRQDRP